MKKLIFVMVAVALIAASCGGGASHEGAIELAPVSATVSSAALVEVSQQVELAGTVEADRVAAVSSRVMAAVAAVHVKAGDTVRKGQLLVEIDPETARGQVAQATGALAQAKAALALAERNHERFKALAAQNAASELELDMARMQYEQAKGAVEQASGAVEAAKSVAADSQVVAPYAGRIAAKLVDVGDLAAPGRPLVMVESLSGRKLVLAVPESLAGGISTGDRIPVGIDSMPGVGRLEGQVVEVAPGADAASHSFMVKVRLEGIQVPTGVAGRGWLTTGSRSAVVVPAEAVIRSGGMTLVVVRDADGRARSRAVSVGDTTAAGQREVLSGLTGQESVLVGLTVAPPDGSPVQGSGR